MTIKITIETGNAAFGVTNPEWEAGRILRKLAGNMDNRGLPDDWVLWDANGANVGTATTTKGDPAE